MNLSTIRIEALASQHVRTGFACGAAALDRYLLEHAGQDARRRIAAPFVAVDASGRVLGYYTLSATSVQLAELPANLVRRLPRYPRLPATLLGRLATDLTVRGTGLGRFLLADAMSRAARSEIASFALVVDAKNEAAARFYRREGFLPLPDNPLRLLRRMTDIAALYDPVRGPGG